MATTTTTTASDADAYDHVFPTSGPLGIDLESSEDGMDAYVVTSTHATIKPGSLLLAVNNQSVVGMTFEEVLDRVKTAGFPKTLSFSAKPRQANTVQHSEFPLPPDFFKSLPPLTAKEEADIKSFMDSKLTEALKLATTSSEELGMSLVKEASGVTIHTKDISGSKIRLVRATTKVNIAADLFMYAALAPDNESFRRIFTMLDPMFCDGQVLYRIPTTWKRYKDGKEATAENINLPFYSVKWATYALPFPLNWRDFVFCELTTWAPGGYGVSLAISIPWVTDKVPSLEKTHHLVRGNIGMSGYIWRNCAGRDPLKVSGADHMQSDITYFLQVEPKGVLPEWVVNLTGATQGMNCLRVTEYAEAQRKFILKMYDKNPELNRVEVFKAVIPTGETFTLPLLVERDGQEIVLDWVLEEHDVSFRLVELGGKDAAEEKVLASFDKQACTMASQPFHFRHKVTKKGNYGLVWDNSYSWFTSKTVHYHFLIL